MATYTQLHFATKTMATYTLDLPFLLPLLAITSLIYFIVTARRRSGPRLPPGPWALPVIGHLHHFLTKLPHRSLRDLAQRHGPLMLIRFGGLPVVVASSADAAREIMKTHDLDFATRPMGRMTRLVLAEGLIMAPYGDAWRQLRKFCTVELLSARRVQSFRKIREQEVRRLLHAVASSTAAPACAVNLSELMSTCVSDSAVRAIMGSRVEDKKTFFRLLKRGVKLSTALSLPDLYPSSRVVMLVSRRPRKMKQHRQELMEFMETVIQEHQLHRAVKEEDEDLVDVLLRIQREGDPEFPLTTDNIKTVIAEMFMAGSETSTTMLQWAMSELVRNPSAMQKAQDEVRHVLKGQARVTEQSLSELRLRYLHLVVKETLRLHPAAPLLLPRECRSACRILGFDVPQGVMVLVNGWAISRDPKIWDAPDEFRPERFHRSVVDFKGTNFEYTPFGAGRRMCPGMTFGLANIELVLASLIYHFDWELPCGTAAADLDMTEESGATVRRKADLLLVPIVRVPI